MKIKNRSVTKRQVIALILEKIFEPRTHIDLLNDDTGKTVRLTVVGEFNQINAQELPE